MMTAQEIADRVPRDGVTRRWDFRECSICGSGIAYVFVCEPAGLPRVGFDPACDCGGWDRPYEPRAFADVEGTLARQSDDVRARMEAEIRSALDG